MRINNFNNINAGNLTYKGNNDNSDDFISSDKKNDGKTVVFVNPKLLQALNNIQNYSIISVGDEKIIKAKDLTIKPETVNDFFIDKNGKIDDVLVKKFINLYNLFLCQEINKTKQEFNYCREIQNEFIEGDEVLDFDNNSKDEAQEVLLESLDSCGGDGFDFIKNILNNSCGLNKFKFAEIAKNAIRDCSEYIPEKTYKKTEFIFNLSKNETGYDFSDMDKKTEFYNLFSNFSNEFDSTLCDTPLSEQLRTSIQRKDKTIDYELGSDIIKSLEGAGGLPYDITTISNSLKKWFKYDKDNKENIIKTVNMLNKSCFDWSDGDDTIKPLIELCFDKNKKFQQERADKILKLAEQADKNIDIKIKDTGFDEYEIYVAEEFANIVESMKDFDN